MPTPPFSAGSVNHLATYLEQAGALIQQEMESRIPNREPKQYLYDLMRDYPARGGKKFRSALVLLACELFGGKIETALTTAVAFELFQNFALIHDDIEDESLIRRGQPTLHRLHGVALALNAGDSMLGLVYDTLLSNQKILGEKRTFEVMEMFSTVMNNTFEGQAIDIGWITHHVFPSKQGYEEMIERKTGWYSGKGPCLCGALLGNAPSEQLYAIGEFGKAIGIGFQARDDVLNLITTTENEAPDASKGGYGKERGGDIAEGKRTLIVIEMFNRLPATDAERLKTILMKTREHVTEEEIAWSINLAQSCGALEATVNYCENQAEIAKAYLQRLPDHPARKLLTELISFLTIRRVS